MVARFTPGFVRDVYGLAKIVAIAWFGPTYTPGRLFLFPVPSVPLLTSRPQTGSAIAIFSGLL